jgi:hypothetical protein
MNRYFMDKVDAICANALLPQVDAPDVLEEVPDVTGEVPDNPQEVYNDPQEVGNDPQEVSDVQQEVDDTSRPDVTSRNSSSNF